MSFLREPPIYGASPQYLGGEWAWPGRCPVCETNITQRPIVYGDRVIAPCCMQRLPKSFLLEGKRAGEAARKRDLDNAEAMKREYRQRTGGRP